MSVLVQGQFISCVTRDLKRKDGTVFQMNEGFLTADGRVLPVRFAEPMQAKIGDVIEFEGYAQYDAFRKQIVYVENKPQE